MKILYLCADPGVPVFGRKGCSTHVRETCLALAELGHEVRVICANAGEDQFGRNKISLIEIKPYESRKLGFDLRRRLTARRVQKRAADLIAEWKPDAIYERYSLYSTAGVNLARRFKLPMMLEVNTFLTREQNDRIRFPLLARWFERRAMRRAQEIAAVALPLMREIAKLRESEDGLHHMPMAVNAGMFRPLGSPSQMRAELELPERFTFGYVGTLTHWHGIDLLHDFARRLRESGSEPFTILIIGGDARRIQKNREKAWEAGLEDVIRLVGTVPHADVPRYMGAMDVGLIPDSTPWSSPSKLFEYQACGVPVLAAHYPAIELAMAHGGEGYFFQPRDTEAMVQRGLELQRDDERRLEMGRQARIRVEQSHSWKAQAARLVEIFSLMPPPE